MGFFFDENKYNKCLKQYSSCKLWITMSYRQCLNFLSTNYVWVYTISAGMFTVMFFEKLSECHKFHQVICSYTDTHKCQHICRWISIYLWTAPQNLVNVGCNWSLMGKQYDVISFNVQNTIYYNCRIAERCGRGVCCFFSLFSFHLCMNVHTMLGDVIECTTKYCH